MLAFEREILQAGVRAVGHDKRRLPPRSVIEPQAVWRSHLARLGSLATPGADPISVLVVLMDVVRTVAIADVEAPFWPNRHVRRAIARGGGILITTRLLWPTLRPYDLALQCRLRDHALLNARQVQKLLVAFLADVDAVPRAVVFVAKAADEFASRVEH